MQRSRGKPEIIYVRYFLIPFSALYDYYLRTLYFIPLKNECIHFFRSSLKQFPRPNENGKANFVRWIGTSLQDVNRRSRTVPHVTNNPPVTRPPEPPPVPPQPSLPEPGPADANEGRLRPTRSRRLPLRFRDNPSSDTDDTPKNLHTGIDKG